MDKPFSPADISRLVPKLKLANEALKEVLEDIERGGMSPSEVKEHLRWLDKKLKDVRKESRL